MTLNLSKIILFCFSLQERMQQWSVICNRLLNGNDKEIRLWTDLIKIELRTRAKVREKHFRNLSADHYE